MEYLSHLARCIALVISLAGAAAAQVGILQIRVIEGEGTVHVPGSRAGRSLTVLVTDEAGKAVAGAAVSFHLPENGPGGTFVNGLRTDVAIADVHGRASIRGFQANRLPGQFQVRIVVSKEQARAGTVSFQYVGETAASSSRAGPGRKWVVIAAAAAGGVLAGALASRGSTASVVPAPPVTPSAPSLTIGTPTISVGKP